MKLIVVFVVRFVFSYSFGLPTVLSKLSSEQEITSKTKIKYLHINSYNKGRYCGLTELPKIIIT